MHRRPLLFVFMLLASLTVARNASAARKKPAPAPEANQAPAEPEQPPSSAPAAESSTQTPEVATVPAPALATPAPAAAPPSFRIDALEGSTIKIGLLLQPQFQSASSVALDGYANNLFIRRTRILVGGTLFGVFEYFLDTDYPNLFLPANVAGAGGAPDTTVKNTPGMNIQDVFATWKALNDYVKVDVGYMLPPLAHNALQGAATLYSWDYFTYSFQHNTAAGGVFNASANPVGRDAGVQLRGLLVDGRVEYRAGLFQGLRDTVTATQVNSRNFFRFAARLQVNLLDPETGFFYAGSYLGAKRVLSVGGSLDLQDSYSYLAGDAFLDMPVGPMGVVTAQFNLAHWDGGTFVPGLPKQTAYMGEAGFLFSASHTSPILRLEHISGTGTQPTQTRMGVGVAYWPIGHNCNLKAFYNRITEDGAAHGANQVNIQLQLYVF